MTKVLMSTANPKLSLETALSNIPKNLSKRLIKLYSELKGAAIQRKHDVVGLKAGKLAEVILRVLQHQLTGSYTPLGNSLGNFSIECDNLAKTPKTAGPETSRLIIPKALLFLYTLRNKRGIGHVGGDVDANEIDGFTITRLSDWCMCELIRVFHNLPLEDAQVVCDAISERHLPTIWNVMGRKRVLNTSLNYKEQTLLILYTELEIGMPTEDLFDWTEHSNRSSYRRDVLGRLHRSRLIEWDKETEMAIISPTGIAEVEVKILPKLD